MLTEAVKFNPRGHKSLQPETIINLTEFSLTLLRTDSNVVTNPYLKAKALELIVIFLYSDSKKELTSQFSHSQIIHVSLLLLTSLGQTDGDCSAVLCGH